jgi:hypothetical protein
MEDECPGRNPDIPLEAIEAPVSSGRGYRPVTLGDGTTAQVAIEGDWAYVRMPSGKEGRMKASSLEAFLAGEGRRPVTREEVATEVRQGTRVALWQLLAFVGLLLAIAGAFILLQLVNGL